MGRYGPQPVEPIIRFMKMIEVRESDECWPFSGCIDRDGYGLFAVKHHVLVRAHRFAYEYFIRPIPGGMTIDHVCHDESCQLTKNCPHRRCCNPSHLKPETNTANILRGNAPSAKNARKTHCPKGHPYDEQNTRIVCGRRTCRICRSNQDKARKTRIKAERLIAT